MAMTKLTLSNLKTIRENIERMEQAADPSMRNLALTIARQNGLDTPGYKQLSKFITHDADMLLLKDKAFILSTHDKPVVIVGPTGTGKEMLAKALHGTRTGRFVDVNCAAIPENLYDAELFGYEAGSFTGAVTPRAGLMQVAEKGTLFLDEVGELPYHVQAKLLRALQENQIRKVGGREPIKIDCRIVCATHRDLALMVKEGRFREDLYARLRMFELRTKPLALRQCDIVPICKALNPAFPSEEIEWSTVDLSCNVRSLQYIISAWEVFGELPSEPLAQ